MAHKTYSAAIQVTMYWQVNELKIILHGAHKARLAAIQVAMTIMSLCTVLKFLCDV